MRFGLCCLFYKENITFKTSKASFLSKKELSFRRKYISDIIFHNCQNLKKALVYCFENNIGSFRVTSRFFPLYTHPEVGYKIEDLQDAMTIFDLLKDIKVYAKEKDIRLTMHPDQFVVLNSPTSLVVENSIKELEYHGYLADLIGADVINIHAGGAYNDKKLALLRLKDNLKYLSKPVIDKLTLENDDRSFTPSDLLGFCTKEKISFVYDVHHHRCLKDSLSEEEVTKRAIATWNREPLFHLSSPKDGWEAKNIKKHADFIDVKDFPKCWKKYKNITIEIEAKAKEIAILQLMRDLDFS